MYQHIREVADAIDREACRYAIGNLQEIRQRLRGLGRQAGSDIFQFHRRSQTMQESGYAYHWGGRDECQFNIRFLDKSDYNYVEFGLAFSLESVRGISIVNDLRPRIQRFNDFINSCNGDFSNYRIAITRPNKYVRVKSGLPTIPNTWVDDGNFIQFFNMYKERADLDGVRIILREFDRLLQLYEYTMASV